MRIIFHCTSAFTHCSLFYVAAEGGRRDSCYNGLLFLPYIYRFHVTVLERKAVSSYEQFHTVNLLLKGGKHRETRREKEKGSNVDAYTSFLASKNFFKWRICHAPITRRIEVWARDHQRTRWFVLSLVCRNRSSRICKNEPSSYYTKLLIEVNA